MIREVFEELKAEWDWRFVGFMSLLVTIHVIFGAGGEPLFFIR